MQKARRAFSKLGRKPGSKTCRHSTSPLALHPDSNTFTDSAKDASFRLDSSYDTSLPELPGDGIAHELPAGKAGAGSPAVHEVPNNYVVHQETQHAPFGYYRDIVSPQTPFRGYPGSGSSISTWSQKPWQSSSSTQYTSNTDLTGFTSPNRSLSELEGSSSSSCAFSSLAPTTNPSRILPVIGENASTNTARIPAGAFDSPKLSVDTRAATETVSWQKQPEEVSMMGDWKFCDSPTSLLPTDGFSDQSIEASQMHELGPADSSAQKSTVHEAAVTAYSSESVAMVEYPGKRTSTSSTWSASSLDLSDDCHITMPLCPCHDLLMQPDVDMSDLVAGAKSRGASSHLLVQDDQHTLRGRIESMFSLLVKLALQKLEAFEPKIQNILGPAFKARPTFQDSLIALNHVYNSQSLTHIHELVSLVFMAFSIAILIIDERDLSQYTGVLYTDMESWADALSSTGDKRAFGTFLEILWLPQVRYPPNSLRQRNYCPFSVPHGLSTQDWRSSPLSNHIGLHTSRTIRLCLRYVDCKYSGLILVSQLTSDLAIHHAAENEVASGFHSADHGLDKDRPPLFLDSAMTDLIQPYLEQELSDTMRAVVSSTAQELRNGELSSFNEVDAHLRSGVLKQEGHFGSNSSSSSHLFSAMCHNAMIMFASRKLAWLGKVLQNSASRVVSQTWAEGVHAPVADIQEQHDGTTLNPEAFVNNSQRRSPFGLNQPNNSIVRTRSQPSLSSSSMARRNCRRRNVSQDTLPSRCPKCSRVFEGTWRRDHLRRHLKSVHGNHYRTCPFCEHTLKDRTDNFAKHVKKCSTQHRK